MFGFNTASGEELFNPKETNIGSIGDRTALAMDGACTATSLIRVHTFIYTFATQLPQLHLLRTSLGSEVNVATWCLYLHTSLNHVHTQATAPYGR